MSDRDILVALLNEHRAMRADLARFVERNAAQVEGIIFELNIGQTPPVGGGVVTDTFGAQTSDTEIITGLLVVVPSGSTTVTLQIGGITAGDHAGFTVPIQNTTELLTPLLWKVITPVRSLTYTAPNGAAQGSTVILWGYAAPAANVPGRLH